MQEPLLHEYKLLKQYKFYNDEQIRDCIYKRSGMQLKILASKTMLSYINLILYEANMYKMVSEREEQRCFDFSDLKELLIRRITNLYREGLQEFPHEQRFWDHFLNFAKKVVPYKAASIYDDLLKVHDDNQSNWCLAGAWSYDYEQDLIRVHAIFQRGLKRHPSSQKMYLTYCDILLREASKKYNDSNLNNNNASDIDLGIERVARLYRDSKRHIVEIEYFLKLLSCLEEPKIVNVTTALQHTIIVDLQELYPRDEALWDALAQRELRGLSMTDLPELARQPQRDGENRPDEPNMEDEEDDDFEEDEDEAGIIWDERPMARRIKLCCEVYRTAMKTLKTDRICILYVNGMIKLNEDMTEEPTMKRASLLKAFNMGHEMQLLCVEHYKAYKDVLSEPPNDTERAECILKEAIERNTSSIDLYEILLEIYITAENHDKITQVHRQADEKLGDDSFPIWQRVILYYTVNYKTVGKLILEQFYVEACERTTPEFLKFRVDYLDFSTMVGKIGKARESYARLANLEPHSIGLHKKMVDIEHRFKKDNTDRTHWRQCYENMVKHFGRTHPEVWLDYIKFEREYGDRRNVEPVSERAKTTLEQKSIRRCLKKLAAAQNKD